MSTASSTNRAVLRSLRHLRPPIHGTKFALKAPSHAQHRPKFVQPKDRIPFWNIVPGDRVVLRTGKVGETIEGSRKKIRGEGIVTSIDREKNWLWLRDVDENNRLAPKSLRHIVPRLVERTEPDRGYGPNVTEIPRPVHYSNVMLKLPDSEKCAVRLVRSRAKYSRRRGMYVWKRFAIVKVNGEQAAKTGKSFQRIEVPWPKVPGKRRSANVSHSDVQVVTSESWAPWRPEDPVHLPGPKPRTSVHSEAQAALLQEQRMKARLANPDFAPRDPSRQGTYAGFTPGRAKSAPIAQPPTPSELVAEARISAAEWSSEAEIEAHTKEGGRAFTPADYLDVAPRHGPASGGDWSALPPVAESDDLTGARDVKSGKLLGTVTRNDLDRMPIELLMKDELSNENGLKWRMRRWRAKKDQAKQEQAKVAREKKDLLEELRVLKL